MVDAIRKKLNSAVEDYFVGLGRLRASGGATSERSNYGPLANLLDTVGATLKPKVFCVGELADQGAGHPDFGLYAAKQIQKWKPRGRQLPERGVVEVKAVDDDLWLTARSNQVSRYWDRYRLVLVTNMRDFVLVGEDAVGCPIELETLRLADSTDDFYTKIAKPYAFARKVGSGLGEYLTRALSHRSTLTEPRDLAWLLASYARDGLARVEAAGGDAPTLKTVREALEEALGVRFEGEKGARFFHSTLVQTLFYGIFSAWVLWSHNVKGDYGPLFEGSHDTKRFSWREAVWQLRAPVLRALFQQLSDPGHLQRLDLVEVLDWTEAALNRVNSTVFFSRFDEGDAVAYFYEPFLEAFDPQLRKQLGVWYTPKEVVRYMVARVDKALKDDLGISDGLASENVYVLDPCCGTGAYLSEVLRRISTNLDGKGHGALKGARIKQAAMERVFGFEIMPAPFVVAHLQVGLTMQNLDAPLANNETERAGIFLTNSLTGWEHHITKPLPFPELEEERDQAERVKQEKPILVILGNPPYNAFAGVAIDEERELFEAYRKTRKVRLHESKGLVDLYVRFFRMAERRITEKTCQGVVCFISNYSWLDGISFAGMRERYLEAFDTIRIDCLNGDRYKTGKVTPDGLPDPSIFSTESNPTGIQVGTAIATLVRNANHTSATEIGFRHLWGQSKHTELMATSEMESSTLYRNFEPVLSLGLPFLQLPVSKDWFSWPLLPDLFPVSFSGAKTNRDSFLVDIDLERLKSRVTDYFDVSISHDEIAQRYPVIMKTAQHFDPRSTRETLLKRGGPNEEGFIRFTYRPFDNRWLYWEAETKLLNDKRAKYKSQVFKQNMWLEARQHESKENFSRGTFVRHFAGDFGNGLSSYFPIWLCDGGIIGSSSELRANLTVTAQHYLDRLGMDVEQLFYHVLTTLHNPAYRQDNAGALRMEWPRIPLIGWPEGEFDAAANILAKSAIRGRNLAQLLDPDTPVLGVSEGALRPEMAVIAVPSTTDGRNMSNADFNLTVGWGHFGQGNAVMPGRGKVVERCYTQDEINALGETASVFGKKTFDVYLNDHAFWCNVPETVWKYRLGGYQVLKKWLSYRERDILGRALSLKEIQYFTDTVRRIAAINKAIF